MSFVAIDLGASFIKGAILDIEKKELNSIIRTPFPSFVANLLPSFREVDSKQILQVVNDLLRKLISQINNCQGIIFTSQMHGFLLTKPNGQALSNFISWQDQRCLLKYPSTSISYFKKIKEIVSLEQQQQLGNELKVGLPITSLFYLTENQLFPKSSFMVTSLPDFVIANLCHCPPKTDITLAASLGLFNLETLNWHDFVLDKLNLDFLVFPEIYNFQEPIGVFKIDGQVIPCYPPLGDQQAAILGVGLKTNELSLNIATGSQVSSITSHLEFGNYQLRPFVENNFIKTITHLPAGRSLNALIHLLSELAPHLSSEQIWQYIENELQTKSSSDLQVNLAFFPSSCGERGFINNICENNLTIGDLFYSAFENMSSNYYESWLKLDVEKSLKNIVFSGGLARKSMILQKLIRDKFKIDYRICLFEEEALSGLLLLAMTISEQSASISLAREEIYRGR